MFFLYQIIVTVILLFSPIILIFRLIKKKEDKTRFKEKLSITTKKKIKGNLIWFHGASVGELLSIVPLIKYYENKNNLDKLLDILEDRGDVSLRIIDWFVTNYSKKNNIYYTIFLTVNDKKTFIEQNNKLLKQFNTYHSYKSQLKSYSKKKFDPFCRRDRIQFEYENNKKIETTIGQLNFFKWAIDNLIIDYIKNNYDQIEEDMNNSYNLQKKGKKNISERKKRQELSKSASRGLNSNHVKVVLDFN